MYGHTTGRKGRALRLLTPRCSAKIRCRGGDPQSARYTAHAMRTYRIHASCLFCPDTRRPHSRWFHSLHSVVTLVRVQTEMSRAVEPSHPLRLSAAAPRSPLGAGVSYATTIRNATAKRCGRCGSYTPHNRTVRPARGLPPFFIATARRADPGTRQVVDERHR